VGANDPAAAGEQTMTPKAYVRTLVLAALLGLPVAFAAVLFMTVVAHLTTLIWDDLPDAAGWSSPPWWFVLLVTGIAGVLVAGAIRLPGRGGHRPIDGLSMSPIPPIELTSVLPAAIATLALGIVLGPEAPLIALGLGLGVIAARLVRVAETEVQLLGLAGAFAAVAALFGGPLLAAFLLLEAVAASGMIPAKNLARALLPGFVAAGTGALVFIGVDGWSGLEQTSFTLPSLPDYPTVRIVDILWCFPVAAVIAGVILAVQRGAHAVDRRKVSRPVVKLVVAGLLVGALAVAFRAAADRPVDLVLFSGQDAEGQIVSEGSAGVLALLVLAKGAAYSLSLGAGFRGGPVFPALTLGVAGGCLAAAILPGLELTPAIAAGVAAAAASALALPFFAVLIAAILVGAASVVPIAIFAAAVGWILALAARKLNSQRHEPA
jgi:H+/Cl- antiporter ClcA